MTHHLVIGLSIIASNASQPQRVAFCVREDEKTHLYVVNLDGTGLKRVTTSPTKDNDPIWSPDGSTIYFTRISKHKEGESRSDAHFWSVRPDGTQLTQLTSGSVYDTLMGWSHDGKRLIVIRHFPKRGIYELDLAKKKLIRPKLQLWRTVSPPNGKWIAHIRSESQTEDDHRTDIWLTSSMQKLGERLTHFKTSIYDVQWSPDGTKLSFIREMPSGENSGDALNVMTISTRKIKTIAKGRGNSMSYARWSPNGKYVCFTEAQRDKEPMTNASFDQLFVIKADGSSRQRLTNHWGNDYSPQWTRDGKFIVIQGERGMTAAAQGSIGDTSSSVIVVSAFGKGERILCPGVYGYLPALSP